MNKYATFQAKLDKFLNKISFLNQIMLNVLVLHSLARIEISLQLRIKYLRGLKLDWFSVSPMYWEEVNSDVANPLVNICMIGSFSCLNLFLLTRIIALASFHFKPSQNCFTYGLACWHRKIWLLSFHQSLFPIKLDKTTFNPKVNICRYC